MVYYFKSDVSSTNSEQCELCVNGPLYIDTRVRDKKRLEKVGNLVKNSYLYR